MDTETNYHATQAATEGSSDTAGSTPSMEALLAESPLPCSLCNWISCMRKAGISLSYSVEKRHIPDMNRPADSPSAAKQSSGSPASNQASGAQSKTKGSIDNMTASGTLRVRYFDLALGTVGILAACMMLKCCCCLKRWL